MKLKGYERTPKQCKERWKNYLRANLKKNPLSDDELRILFLHYKNLGTSWTKISSFFGNRSETILKNSFYVIIKKLKSFLKKIIRNRLKKSKNQIGITINLSLLNAISEKLDILIVDIMSRPIPELVDAIKELLKPKKRKIICSKAEPNFDDAQYRQSESNQNLISSTYHNESSDNNLVVQLNLNVANEDYLKNNESIDNQTLRNEISYNNEYEQYLIQMRDSSNDIHSLQLQKIGNTGN